MNEIIEKVKENKKIDFFIALLIGFLAGIAVGLIVSPVKNGIAIGSYNGCNNRISDSNHVNKDKKN
ncbi:MAG: hypothetical protein ACI4K5_05190 [Ruminococcus sp.]